MDILTGDAAQEVTLGGIQAVQTQTADSVAYHFHLDGVQFDVSGSASIFDNVRRVAESLIS